MFLVKDLQDRPKLLVSVRNADEAVDALAGGAEVIDVKEPNRGALGPADPLVLAEVLQAVNGRVPVSAAAGELREIETNAPVTAIPSGIAAVKIGLAGCRSLPDWPQRWRDSMAISPGSLPVAVVYADWRSANAPGPEAVFAEARSFGSPALLVDTFDKSAGGLLDHWPLAQLAQFVQAVQEEGIAIVLAGSLSGDSLKVAGQLRPDLIAVRGAACEGGRCGTITTERVRSVREMIRMAKVL